MKERYGVRLYSLDEIMPQYSCRILQDTNKDADLRAFVLYRRPRMTVLYAEQFTQLAETRETPIAFLRDKAMVRI